MRGHGCCRALFARSVVSYLISSKAIYSAAARYQLETALCRLCKGDYACAGFSLGSIVAACVNPASVAFDFSCSPTRARTRMEEAQAKDLAALVTGTTREGVNLDGPSRLGDKDTLQATRLNVGVLRWPDETERREKKGKKARPGQSKQFGKRNHSNRKTVWSGD